MTVAVTTLRSTLATALENAGVWQVFSFPPASPIANSVIISWDSPMLEPSNNQYNIAPKANLTITCIVPMLDNQGGLIQLENMVTGVFTKLAASTLKLNVSSVSAPSVLAEAQEMLTATINVSAITSWS